MAICDDIYGTTQCDGYEVFKGIKNPPSEELVKKYSELLNTELVGEKSIQEDGLTRIDKVFTEFGLSNVEKGQIIAQYEAQSIVGLSEIQIRYTVELLKMVEERKIRQRQIAELDKKDAINDAILCQEIKKCELLDIQKEQVLQELEKTKAETAQIVLETQKVPAEIALIKSQEAKNIADLTKNIAEIALIKSQEAKNIADLTKNIAELELIKSQVSKNLADVSKYPAEKALIEAQTANAIKERDVNAARAAQIKAEANLIGAKRSLVEAQKSLAQGQARNYKDNLLVKACEFRGNVASFAVSSGATQAGEAVRAFNSTVGQLESRSR